MSAPGRAALEDSSATALERFRDEGALDRIARLAAAATGAPLALVQLARDDGRDAVRATASEARAGGPAAAAGLTAIADRAATTAECIALAGPRADRPATAEGADSSAVGAALAVPIAVSDERVRGAIAVAATEPRPWTERDRVVLQDLARVAAGVIESRVRRSRLHHRIRDLEGQLRQARKLEAIGRLAGGIAHDFNNLMLTVSSYTQLMLERPDFDDDTRDDLREVAKAVDRATELAARLLNASRKQMPEPRLLDLNGVVDGMQKTVRRLIGEDVRLVTRAEAANGRVKADPGQLEQVILNLVVNARDAMPEGGTLTIRTTERELGSTDHAGHAHADGDVPLAAGRYVVLTVEDTGVGMAPEVRERIFEPFFTTKPEGKGTGIGLATVYGTIRQGGGAVEVESEPGRGTTFHVYLPAVPAHAADDRERRETSSARPDAEPAQADGGCAAPAP